MPPSSLILRPSYHSFFWPFFLARKSYPKKNWIGRILTQESPIQGYWTPGVGICLNDAKTTLANGIVNTVADALTTALPIPMIIGLRMPIGQKIGVMVLLGLGFIVTIAGIVRCVICPLGSVLNTNFLGRIIYGTPFSRV
jgi:rhodopsin domain-containing protein